MTSRTKREQEHLKIITRELDHYGIKQYEIGRFADHTHKFIKFYCHGKMQTVGFAGSGDWRAWRRTRSILRGILTGKKV